MDELKHINDGREKYLSRIGETKLMNCGMNATIIDYRKYEDIDVQFDDGLVRKNVDYGQFLKGGISNPSIKKAERLGETRMMNCGMNATIIAYRKSTDIDIQFEDGYIKENIGYAVFKKGTCINPNIRKEKRVGETRMMNCGMNATIIDYRDYTDIDIQFEDGEIIKKVSYYNFKLGKVSSLKDKNVQREIFKNERMGETRMMNCGMNATIIDYRKSTDIDVQFDDGFIRRNMDYGQFLRGGISNPTIKRGERLGETRMMNCGMNATIIAYRKSSDIDIQFDDGFIRKNVTYYLFKIGKVSNNAKKKL